MLKGRAFKFGDDISTDHIIPGRFAHLRSNLPELTKHAMEDADPTFVTRAKSGDFIVAGANFGLGSSREHAPLVIKMAGIKAILAKSVARIFFRNAVNLGLAVVESDDACEVFEDGETVAVDTASGYLRSEGGERRAELKRVPESVRAILEAGGLVPYLKARVSLDKANE